MVAIISIAKIIVLTSDLIEIIIENDNKSLLPNIAEYFFKKYLFMTTTNLFEYDANSFFNKCGHIEWHFNIIVVIVPDNEGKKHWRDQ